MSANIETLWRTRGWRACSLWPVSQLYRLIMFVRRLGYQRGVFKSSSSSLPVVVVGNLVVGGTGKTPLTAYLVQEFLRLGWRPGIVSRGYGGQRHVQPHVINDKDTASSVGDEPLMLSRQSTVPVCVCVKRADAVRHLQETSNCDIVFSDDGLQHLAMQRSAEVVVVDGQRGFGNGWRLPAGPLRESIRRWRNADIIATQGSADLHSSITRLNDENGKNPFQLQRFSLEVFETINCRDSKTSPIDQWRGQSVIAMAGIGNPERFFSALTSAGLNVTGIAKPDHHDYSLSDFKDLPQLPVLVTSKDAVKLRALSALPVEIFEVKTRVSVSDALQVCIVQLESQLRSAYRSKA